MLDLKHIIFSICQLWPTFPFHNGILWLPDQRICSYKHLSSSLLKWDLNNVPSCSKGISFLNFIYFLSFSLTAPQPLPTYQWTEQVSIKVHTFYYVAFEDKQTRLSPPFMSLCEIQRRILVRSCAIFGKPVTWNARPSCYSLALWKNGFIASRCPSFSVSSWIWRACLGFVTYF